MTTMTTILGELMQDEMTKKVFMLSEDQIEALPEATRPGRSVAAQGLDVDSKRAEKDARTAAKDASHAADPAVQRLRAEREKKKESDAAKTTDAKAEFDIWDKDTKRKAARRAQKHVGTAKKAKTAPVDLFKDDDDAPRTPSRYRGDEDNADDDRQDKGPLSEHVQELKSTIARIIAARTTSK